MADAATVLLVMSCRVFLAGKVDELVDVVGAGVVAGKVSAHNQFAVEHTGSDMVFRSPWITLPANACPPTCALRIRRRSQALRWIVSTGQRTRRTGWPPTLE